MNIEQIVHTLNEASDRFEFGHLQQIRTDYLGLTRRPAKAPFGKRTIFDQFAYHVGGRCELQFNVGCDKSGLRWGVAISLQPSHSLPDVTVQFPKLDKLSEFIRVHGDEHLSDFLMWHHSDSESEPSDDRLPEVVPRHLYAEGTFLFLGKHAPVDQFDADAVMRDFDSLLPLYKFVEFSTSHFPMLDDTSGFEFTPGYRPPVTQADYLTTATRVTGQIEVVLRHRRIQDTLERELNSEVGKNVARELRNGIGGFVDLIAKRNGKLEFYEIKVARSARACIREALGQLLEYGFWPGAAQPDKLVVAGEPSLDDSANKYLQSLRNDFRIPISYRQVVIED